MPIKLDLSASVGFMHKEANIRVFKTQISNAAWKWVSPHTHTHTALWHLPRFESFTVQSLVFQHTQIASSKTYAKACRRIRNSFTKYSWPCQTQFSQNLVTPYINWTFLSIWVTKTGRRFQLGTSEDNFVAFHSLNEYIRLNALNTVGYATTNECYNEQYLSIKSGWYKGHRRSTRVRKTYRAFPLWLERQSSSLLSFVRFSYQFSSVICLFAPLAVKIFF
jgi:hypothetical protein